MYEEHFSRLQNLIHCGGYHPLAGGPGCEEKVDVKARGSKPASSSKPQSQIAYMFLP